MVLTRLRSRFTPILLPFSFLLCNSLSPQEYHILQICNFLNLLAYLEYFRLMAFGKMGEGGFH